MLAFRKSNAIHYLLFEKSSVLRYCLLLEKQRHFLFAFRKAKRELLYEKMLRVGLLPLFKAPILISEGHQKSDARHPLSKLVESSKNSWSEKSPSRE